MIAHYKTHAIVRTPAGKYRAFRDSAFWVGDFDSHAEAARAIDISAGALAKPSQRGHYMRLDATEADIQALLDRVDPHFREQPVTPDDVARTILPGEAVAWCAGMPSKTRRVTLHLTQESFDSLAAEAGEGGSLSEAANRLLGGPRPEEKHAESEKKHAQIEKAC